MGRRFVALSLALLVAACASSPSGEPSVLRDVDCVRDPNAGNPDLWEPSIQGYEAADEERPPDAGSVVFVGSSSILFWGSLAADMAPIPVLNRGFGGSVIADVVHFADRIVLPYEPSAIVLYAGDNDIAFGSSADCTLRDFEAFVEHVRAAAPATPLYFISIKPSPSRLGLWTEMSRANALIQTRAAESSAVEFIDVSDAMLDEQGQPMPELFLEDGLHLTPAGYALWASIVRPRLRKDLAF